jgi:hypothetical protein
LCQNKPQNYLEMKTAAAAGAEALQGMDRISATMSASGLGQGLIIAGDGSIDTSSSVEHEEADSDDEASGDADITLPPLPDGITIADTSTVGKAMIADKAFAIGDVIFVEPPLVCLFGDGASGNVSYSIIQRMVSTQVQTTSKIDRVALSSEKSGPEIDIDVELVSAALYTFIARTTADTRYRWTTGFYAPMEDVLVSILMPICEEVAALDAVKSLSLSSEQLCRAVLVIIFNAHEYSPQDGDTCRPATTQTDVQCNQLFVGLFPIASYAAHSCLPNAMRQPLRKAREVTYLAVREIRPGDVICISYIDEEKLRLPTCFRRALLYNTKRFWCTCERCAAPDRSRPLRCQGIYAMTHLSLSTLRV